MQPTHYANPGLAAYKPPPGIVNPLTVRWHEQPVVSVATEPPMPDIADETIGRAVHTVKTSPAVAPSPSRQVAVAPSPAPQVAADPSAAPQVAVVPSPTPQEAADLSPATPVAVAPSPSTELAVAPSPSTDLAVAPSPSVEVAVAPSPAPQVKVAPSPARQVKKEPAPRAVAARSDTTKTRQTPSTYSHSFTHFWWPILRIRRCQLNTASKCANLPVHAIGNLRTRAQIEWRMQRATSISFTAPLAM
jgi:hypothetical protein